MLRETPRQRAQRSGAGLQGVSLKPLLTLTVLLVALLVPASAQATTWRGYVPAEYKTWIGDASQRVPMPHGPITISAKDCRIGGGTCYIHADRTIYMAEDYGFSATQRRSLLIHEIGHAVDLYNMTPAKRRQFRGLLELYCGWTDDSWRGCDPVPAEQFAEQYVACAYGIPRASVAERWYDYLPLPSLEPALCALIRSN